jgi:hypothetical protein
VKQKAPKPEPRGRASTKDQHAVKRLFDFQFGAVFDKSAEQLAPGDRHRLHALRLYYAYRHNGYVLAEALDLCTRNSVNPPIWVLESVSEGIQRFIAGSVTLPRALALTKRHREEYDQYRTEHEVMGAIRKRINADPKRRIAPACNTVAGTYGWTADAAEKAYRRFWKDFFDYVSGKRQA